MSVQSAPAPAAKEDLSGQSRLGRNVAFAWGGYLINIVAGIVMPRLISDHLGKTTLGVWDFAWTIVTYFTFVQLGLSGSVTRYVARHRATGDYKALSRSVSTIALSLKFSAALVAIITIISAIWIVPMFGKKLGAELHTAQWVVGYLGFEVAGSLLLTVYGAIIVGCHRWDIHNSTGAISYAVMTIAMIVVLRRGGGLAELALVHWISMNGSDMVRWRLARKVCPEFVMDHRLADWATWKEQARYSAKNVLPRLADLISNGTFSMLITRFLGVDMLAVFSRPRALMSQGRTITAKFGSILIPTASSLEAQAQKGALQRTFFQSNFFISALTMPGIAILIVFGDEVIHLWMGKDYIYPGLVTILAIGCFPGLVQEPVWSILSGMNRHGRLAWYKIGAAICSAAALWLGLALFHWSLLSAAVAFVIPQLVADGIIAPSIACSLLEVSKFDYFRDTYLKPMIAVVPFLGCLEITFHTYQTQPIVAAISGAVALAILAALYFKAFKVLKSGKH